MKEFASEVLELHRERREARKPRIEEIPYDELEEELKEEIYEFLYDDLLYFMLEKDTAPSEKQMKKITGNICTAYERNFYIRIIPDDSWTELCRTVSVRVVSDLQNENFEPSE